MKLAIFGHPRSGSTMLSQIISRHLQMEHTGEVFNPAVTTILGTDEGRLRLANLSSDLSQGSRQSRAARLKIFKRHLHQDYIIKVQSGDTRSPDIIDCIREHYPVIAIERRNVPEGFLSMLIAMQYKRWQWMEGTPRPVYKPFTVTQKHMRTCGEYWIRYYTWRDHMRPRAIIFYEDMVAQPIRSTLERAGVYQEGQEIFGSPTQKIHTLEDKMALIKNSDEVIDYLQGILYMFTKMYNRTETLTQHSG